MKGDVGSPGPPGPGITGFGSKNILECYCPAGPVGETGRNVIQVIQVSLECLVNEAKMVVKALPERKENVVQKGHPVQLQYLEMEVIRRRYVDL